VDEFNYGIHAYGLLSAVMGPGAAEERHLGRDGQRRVGVRWGDGRMGLLCIGETQANVGFYATIVTDRGVYHLDVDPGKLYRTQLETVLPYLAGQAASPPVGLPEWIEPERCAIAARRSWLEGDREVVLDTLADDDPGYDGAEFARAYRKMRYPDS